MKKIDWKKIAPYLVALVVFVGFALAYCSPILEGKVLYAGDVNTWRGGAQEAIEYRETTGKPTAWTNSMFGGMPAYQITGGGLPSGSIRSKLSEFLHLGLSDQSPIGHIFAYFAYAA